MNVTNIKDLERELNKRINKALSDKLANTVKDVMAKHIDEDVYDVYTPKKYVRRYNRGGLADMKNIVGTIDSASNTLVVSNITVGNASYERDGLDLLSENANKPIADVIETGRGYDIPKWEYYGVSRPFIQNTIAELKANNHYIKSLKEELIKMGLEVK